MAQEGARRNVQVADDEVDHRMMPPTPQQSSSMPIEEMQWQTELEVQGSSWSARERTVSARMADNLSKKDNLKVDTEGPEDSEVNLMCILTQACRRGSNIFEIFSTLSCKQSAMG